MKLRTLAASMCAATAVALVVPASIATPQSLASTTTLKQRLANVIVPAYCQMPKQRLHNGKTQRRYLPASGSLLFGAASKGGAMRVHLGSTGTQVLAQYGCNAGNVSWPTVIDAYDARNRLIGFIKLGNISHTEHADITQWRSVGHTVRVTWISYEGCCFHRHTHRQTLTMSGGHLHLA